jgi:hypothetical protein
MNSPINSRLLSRSRLKIGLIALAATALVALPISVAPAFATSFSVKLTSSPKVGTPIVPVFSHQIADATYTYAWTGGSTKPGYVPTADQIGQKIAVIVTQHETGSADVVAEAVTTHAVVAGTFATHTVTIQGSRHVGQKLFAKAVSWSPVADATAYQWYRNGALIAGATDSSYTLTASDDGTKVSVKRTDSRAGYTTASKTSTSTVPIGDPYFTDNGVLMITGTDQVGKTLAVGDSVKFTPTADVISYQWTIDGVAVAGATGSSFLVPSTAAGKLVGMREKASAAGIATTTLVVNESMPTAEGILAPISDGAVTGTLAVGAKLGVRLPTFQPGATSFSYQWIVQEPGNQAMISGATHSTYRIPAVHDGQIIGVQVFASRAGYAPQTFTFLGKFPTSVQ